MKKSNSATGSSNFCSLCNCSIDLAVYNYTACTVIVHTGDISRNVNDSTVGYTVKVKLYPEIAADVKIQVIAE